MLTLYRAIAFVVSIALFPFFMLRERGRALIFERYGSWNISAKDVIWFHGASFGEINGLLPILKRCRESLPDNPILLTSTSVTGLTRGEGYADFLKLLPFDCSIWIARAVRSLSVKRLILTETELWPELLQYASSSGIQVSIVNGKIGDFSFRSYRALQSVFSDNIAKISPILVSDSLSAERFIALGAKPEVVSKLGNSKYDLEPSVKSAEETLKFRAQFFVESGPVLVLGSLRPGEERVWFPEIVRALSTDGQFRVVVAPRHKEKFDYFAAELTSAGIPFVRRSERRSVSASEARVVLLDSMGELEKVYSFATLVFIGGTIENWGGHNPLEPAAYGAAVALGPYRSNIAEIAVELSRAQAIVDISGRESVRAALAELSSGEVLRKRGKAAYDVWRQNTGASERIFAALKLGA